MIVSKEFQEKIVNDYLKNNSTEKTQGFIDGINKAFELIDKILKENKNEKKSYRKSKRNLSNYVMF